MNDLTPHKEAEKGKGLYQEGDYARAAEAFGRAAAGYAHSGEPLESAEMANNRSVALLQLGDAPGALAALEGTAAVFEAAGDRRRLALAWGNEAAALEGIGRANEAETTYWKSANLLKELGETEHHAQVMKTISALQLKGGRQLEALASMQAGVEALEKPSALQRLLKRLLKIPGRFLR